MKKILFSLLTLILTLSFSVGYAAGSSTLPKDIKYTISPLFGYESVFRATPTPHTLTHTMYGARLTAGTDLISGELEYTKGSDTENFLVAPQLIATDDEKVKLGIKSTYRFNDVLFASGRIGGQAKKSVRTETSNGVAVKIEDPIAYDPYAGASLGVKLGPVSISAGATAVIHSTTDNSKNDIQNTLSISLGI